MPSSPFGIRTILMLCTCSPNIIFMFFFSESDEQRVSAMVSLAKVSVAFMQVMSDMSETECNGQLKLQKTLLKVAFNWMFPQGLPMFTRQALHDFPLTTAKLLKVLKLQPKLTRYAACPSATSCTLQTRVVFIHNFVSTDGSPTPNLAAH